MQINHFDLDSRVELKSVCLNVSGKLAESVRVYFNNVPATICGLGYTEDDLNTVISFSWQGVEGWNYGEPVRLVDESNNSELGVITDYGNGFILDAEGNKVYV